MVNFLISYCRAVPLSVAVVLEEEFAEFSGALPPCTRGAAGPFAALLRDRLAQVC